MAMATSSVADRKGETLACFEEGCVVEVVVERVRKWSNDEMRNADFASNGLRAVPDKTSSRWLYQ